MDIILLIFIVLLLVADMHRHMKMLKLQEKDNTRTKELSAILEAMQKSNANGGITFIRPTDELVRLVFSEYLKVYLQKRLDERIDELNKRGMPAPGMKFNTIVEDEMKRHFDYEARFEHGGLMGMDIPVIESKSGKKFLKHATKI